MPPSAETVQLNGLPTVWPEPHETVTTNGCGAMLTVVDPMTDMPLESVTENDSLLEPFRASVTEKVPVPT